MILNDDGVVVVCNGSWRMEKDDVGTKNNDSYLCVFVCVHGLVL